MRVFFLTLFAFFGQKTNGDFCPSTKPAIKICSTIHVEDVRFEKIDSVDERTVATVGHVEGLKPLFYNLSFHFWTRDPPQFEASAEIRVAVKAATNRVVLNRHTKAPDIDYERITIDPVCGSGRRITPSQDYGCIEKVTIFNDSFVCQLTKPLMVDQIYTINIPSFRSHAYNDQNETGSVGLASTGSERQGYWGLTTIFQMRYARTVFPCFDYPNLKANFRVCVDHPTNWRAASNTPIANETNFQKSGDPMTKSCFHETPPIPTYVFTIALMENYSSSNLSMQDGPLIELYSPREQTSDLTWIMQGTVAAVRSMQSITNFSYALPRLANFVVYPSPFWGIENFGLITTEGAFMEMGADGKASVILNHEVVHQWLGDVVTISEWRQICLQEGLTAFLEWKLSEQLQGVSMESQALEALRGSQNDYPSFLGRYNRTQQIADRCFGLPPLFFKLISDFYGFRVWEKFLRKLITDKRYSNADMKFWDQLLVESTGDKNLEGYIEAWFDQPGYAFIFITTDKQSINFTQGRCENFDHILINNETVRPMPLSILSSDNNKTVNVTVPKKQNFIIKITSDKESSLIIDPESRIVARKIYQLKNYQKFLCIANGRCNEQISSKYLQSIFGDFCKAFALNAFPWGHDAASFDDQGWIDLFDGLVKSKISKYCKCCMSRKEEIKKDWDCGWRWNDECRNLRILQLIGRNYTIDQDDQNGQINS